MTSEIIAGLIGAATAALIALVNGYLTSKAKVVEVVRERRIDCYPQIWKMTSMMSVWPRSDLALGDLNNLYLALRRWYYETGGLYLSENASARYREVQQILARILPNIEAAREDSSFELSESTYTALKKACIELRMALTEDLETREQRRLFRSLNLMVRHKLQRRGAKRRIAAAGPEPDEPRRHVLEDWQHPGKRVGPPP